MLSFLKRDIDKKMGLLIEQHQRLSSDALKAQDFALGFQRLLDEANRKLTYIKVQIDKMEIPDPPRPKERLLRLPEVMEQTGLNRNKIYSAKDFPSPIKIGARTSAWVESEVQEWIYEQIQKQSVAGRKK
jgi:prophage regulatory protein